MSVKRTQQFQYFQSKAKHYQKIKKIKPSIHSFRAEDEAPYYRPRPHSLTIQYQKLKDNQNLVNNILSIRKNSKSRLQVQGGYSRYNFYDTGRISKYNNFKDQLKNRQIDYQNHKLGTKILTIKPSIGTITDWNHDFHNSQSRKKIASKTAQKTMPIYYKDKFMPQHYVEFMDRDQGSTVKLRDRLFELPKHLSQLYTDGNKSLLNQKSSKINEFKKLTKDTSAEFAEN